MLNFSLLLFSIITSRMTPLPTVRDIPLDELYLSLVTHLFVFGCLVPSVLQSKYDNSDN